MMSEQELELLQREDDNDRYFEWLSTRSKMVARVVAMVKPIDASSNATEIIEAAVSASVDVACRNGRSDVTDSMIVQIYNEAICAAAQVACRKN
jgi:hypothetical protein